MHWLYLDKFSSTSCSSLQLGELKPATLRPKKTETEFSYRKFESLQSSFSNSRNCGPANILSRDLESSSSSLIPDEQFRNTQRVLRSGCYPPEPHFRRICQDSNTFYYFRIPGIFQRSDQLCQALRRRVSRHTEQLKHLPRSAIHTYR